MAEKIKGITIEFRGDATPLTKAIRTVNSEISKTESELKKVNTALKFNPGSVDLWKQKQTLLKEKISETKDKLTALKNAQKQMDAAQVDKNTEEYRKLQREIIDTESKLKTFKQQLREIGNVKLHALGEQFKQVGDKMMKAGKNLTTYITVPLAAAGTVGVKKFAEVDKTMQLTNKTMGNTAEEADLLNKAMKDAAANSTYGMNDAATATLNFARAGLKAEEAADTLAPAMNLAAGEGGDLDTVSAGLVATINSFGDPFDKAADYADVFANACNNSALDIDSLSNSMSIAAPIFSAAGYSVKDAALYMGTMANAGINANKAATSLKTGLARLVSPAKAGAEWMDKLGIEVTNADGSMKDSVTIQKELHEAFAGLSESEQLAAASAIFGKNQMSNWLALIKTSPDDVDKLNKELGVTGTTSDMAEAMMSGFGGSLEKLKSGIDVLATSFGEALAPTIQKVANGIQKLVDWFNSLSPKQQEVIAKITLLVAAIGPLLVAFGAIAKGLGSIISLIGTIGPLIGTLGGAISGLASGPLLLIVAAIAAAIAIGVLLYKNWDKIKAAAEALKKKVAESFNNLKTAITNAWTAIKTAATNAWTAVKSAIITPVTNAVSAVKEKIGEFRTWLSEKWTSIKEKATETWNAIKEKIKQPIIDAIASVKEKILAFKEWLSEKWTSIKEKVTDTWNAIKDKIKQPIIDAIASVKEKVRDIKTWLAETWSDIKTKAADMWSAIRDKITEPFTKAKEKIEGIIDKIKDLFPIDLSNFFGKIKLPHFSWDWKEVGDTGIELPSLSVDWWKQGGIFTKPTLLGGGNGVGEAGAEAVLPLAKLWEEMDRRFAGGEGITINVYASDGMNVNDLALKVEQRLVQLQKQRTKAYGV